MDEIVFITWVIITPDNCSKEGQQWNESTTCPRSSDPIYGVTYYINHYFMDTQYMFKEI